MNCRAKSYVTIFDCWFARDVKAAMLMVKNKSFPLLWELSTIFT